MPTPAPTTEEPLVTDSPTASPTDLLPTPGPTSFCGIHTIDRDDESNEDLIARYCGDEVGECSLDSTPRVETSVGTLCPLPFDLKRGDDVEVCCPPLTEDVVSAQEEAVTLSGAASTGGTATVLTVVGAVAAVVLVAGAAIYLRRKNVYGGTPFDVHTPVENTI